MGWSRWVRCLGAGLFTMAAAAGVQANKLVSEADFIVFVGQKISVEEFQLPACDQCVIMDEAFHAYYRIMQKVYGTYPDANIRFDAFDHYGRPAFADYEYVLLFVRKDVDGKWRHEKYQYFPVYETQDGGWAGCGSANRFEHPSIRGPNTARPIEFKRPVVERIGTMSAKDLDVLYPRSDWRRANGLATCLRGTPVAELFEGKKRGVLKARGLFK